MHRGETKGLAEIKETFATYAPPGMHLACVSYAFIQLSNIFTHVSVGKIQSVQLFYILSLNNDHVLAMNFSRVARTKCHTFIWQISRHFVGVTYLQGADVRHVMRAKSTKTTFA